MSGPVKNFRDTIEEGCAPAGTWNGYKAKQQIRKAQNKAKGSVEIMPLVPLDDEPAGEPDEDIAPLEIDLSDGVQVASKRYRAAPAGNPARDVAIESEFKLVLQLIR